MKTKILFTDLDGTLLNDQKEITVRNQEAIDEALRLGHKVVISTGRPLVSACIQARRLGLTKDGCYAITYNGGQIYDIFHQKTLYGKPLPKSLAAPIFAAAHQAGVHIQTYSDTEILSEYDTEELHSYSAATLIPYRVGRPIDSILTADPYKLLAVSFTDHAKLVQFRQEVLGRYPGTLDSMFSSDAFLEIVPSGISKGFAVHWMCEFLGIPLEHSVAAGDAQNDISMLQAAGIGAVMCNAAPDIQAYGDYITTHDNNHDGVAEIIHRFIL